MNFKYSIIMVTYNHEKYISKAIESVINQKTDEQFEILIGDDGSKDNTVQILNEFSKKYNFIKVFSHVNYGLSKNVYELLINAKGEYIAILEGDDYWIDNEKLEKQRRIIEEKKCLATACNSLKIDESGNELGFWNNRTKSKILSKKDIILFQTKLWHPSALMFKNIFKDNKDKYKVIAEASRMGGNHSGLINLLANEGKIFLDITPMTIWLSIQKKGATNYSSQKVDSLNDFYESMKKYEYYNDVFDMDYSKYIYCYYKLCKQKLRREVISKIGYKYYIMNLLYSFISLFDRIKEKLFIK